MDRCRQRLGRASFLPCLMAVQRTFPSSKELRSTARSSYIAEDILEVLVRHFFTQRILVEEYPLIGLQEFRALPKKMLTLEPEVI